MYFILVFVCLTGVLTFMGQGFGQEPEPSPTTEVLSTNLHQTASIALQAGISRQELPAGNEQTLQLTLPQKIQRQISTIQASFEKVEKGLATLAQGFTKLPQDLGGGVQQSVLRQRHPLFRIHAVQGVTHLWNGTGGGILCQTSDNRGEASS